MKPSLLCVEQSQASQFLLVQQMLQALHHLCGFSMTLLRTVYVSIFLGSPALGTVVQVCLSTDWKKGSVTLLNLLAMNALSNVAWEAFGFL